MHTHTAHAYILTVLGREPSLLVSRRAASAGPEVAHLPPGMLRDGRSAIPGSLSLAPTRTRSNNDRGVTPSLAPINSATDLEPEPWMLQAMDAEPAPSRQARGQCVVQ